MPLVPCVETVPRVGIEIRNHYKARAVNGGSLSLARVLRPHGASLSVQRAALGWLTSGSNLTDRVSRGLANGSTSPAALARRLKRR